VNFPQRASELTVLKIGVALLVLVGICPLLNSQTRTPSQEEMVTCLNCGTSCGSTGGTGGAVAFGTETLVSSIDLDGVSAEFSLDPKDPYGNFYW